MKAPLLPAFLAGALLATAFSPAFADDVPPPLIWRFDPPNIVAIEKDRIAKYEIGPYADSQSRLEAELKADIPLRRLPEARRMMDGLVANQSDAEGVFGKNYRVVKTNKAPRDVWDSYLDSKDGSLAKEGASLRIRVENGVAQLNFKPPGGNRFANGVVHRTETGITVKLGADGKLSPKQLAFFENTRLVDNPLREFSKLFPGKKLRTFLRKQLEVHQTRDIYEIQVKEGEAWVKAGEVTLDKVTGRDPANHKTTAKFGTVEFEGEHLGLQLTAAQQQALANSTWDRPHNSSDTHNPAFNDSPDVKNIHRMAEGLSAFLKVKPSSGSKYSLARAALGKKGVTFRDASAAYRTRAAAARFRRGGQQSAALRTRSAASRPVAPVRANANRAPARRARR